MTLGAIDRQESVLSHTIELIFPAENIGCRDIGRVGRMGLFLVHGLKECHRIGRTNENIIGKVPWRCFLNEVIQQGCRQEVRTVQGFNIFLWNRKRWSTDRVVCKWSRLVNWRLSQQPMRWCRWVVGGWEYCGTQAEWCFF